MIPKKIYLSEEELEKRYMCARMVSCNAPIGNNNVEYTDLSQVWHDVDDNPKPGEYILVMFDSGNFTSWNVTTVADITLCFQAFNVERWAYTSDLIPKTE